MFLQPTHSECLIKSCVLPRLSSAAQASFEGRPPVVQTKKERENIMSEAKPNIEGTKKFRRPMRAAGQPTKKEFVTKVLGLESHTFDVGNAKYAAKYKKMVDAIANYIQREHKGGADIPKVIKALSLPTLQVPV